MTSTESVACTRCGAASTLDAEFCSTCGGRLDLDLTKARTPVQSAPAPAISRPSPARAEVPRHKRTLNDLPSPLTLLPGERARFRGEFTPHSFLTHLKVFLVVTDRRLVMQRPNTLFGVIPHGYVQHESPLGAVSQVSVGHHLSSRKIAWAAGLGFFGLFLIAEDSGGFGVLVALVAWACAAWQLFTARTHGIFFRNSGAGLLGVPAGRTDEPTVDRAKDVIDGLMYPPNELSE